MNHDQYTDSYVTDILLTTKTIAVVGASLRDSRPSYWISGFLLGKGYHVFPVNPAHAGKILLGQVVHSSLADLPHPVDMIDVFRRSEALPDLVDEILALPWRPRAIWCQAGIRNDAAAAKAEAEGIKVVMDRTLVGEYLLVYDRIHHPPPVAAA